MLAVKKGEDRQSAHEKLRKLTGRKNVDFAKELGIDPIELEPYLSPSKLVGRAPDQVQDFLKGEIEPFLMRHKSSLASVPQIEI
jgi:adenylosuccinate lyase